MSRAKMMQFPAPGQAPRIEGAPGGLPGACAGAHIMRLLYWGAAHWGDRPLHGA